MAKTITRQTLKLFGKDGATSNFGEFGSQAAGSPVTTKAIATIQGLAAWLNGWQDAVAAGQAPYLQDMNSLLYVLCYELCYQLQDGVAEWDSGTSYYIGSVVRRTGTSEIYSSLADDNLNQALPTAGSSNANWQFVAGMISSSFRVGGPLAMNSQKITGVADGTASGDVTPFQQTSTAWGYRRPRLVYNSSTLVDVEAGLEDGSSSVQVMFRDGKLRSDSTTLRIQLSLARVASLTGTAQSGLRTGSQTANTWYYVYAVKSQVNTTDIVMVADTVAPVAANYATLNSNFGTNSWVYLGALANGNGIASNNVILPFTQIGNTTLLRNNFPAANLNPASRNSEGILLATTASATTLTWAYASGGTVGTQVPAVFGALQFQFHSTAGTQCLAGNSNIVASGNDQIFTSLASPGGVWTAARHWVGAEDGAGCNGAGGAQAFSILMCGWQDKALGSNGNPTF